MAGSRKYNDEEVRAILDRALKHESPGDVSHDDLVAIGSEVGISREAIDSAARDVDERRDVGVAQQSILGRRRRWLVSHASVYLVVNAFLFAINFLTTPGEWWVLFPVLSWGLALLLHARLGLSRQISDRWLSREQQRMAKNRRLSAGEGAAVARVRVQDEPAELGEALADSETAEVPVRAPREER